MTIRIYNGLPTEPPAQPGYLTIGNFDGVHLGHQALVGEMAAQAHAHGCLAGVLTFDPHPLAVLRPQLPLNYLTLMPEREDLLGLHGLDFVVVLPFNREVAATSAADFMAALSRSLRLRALWVGSDFALGRGREGTPERLAEIGATLGYSVHVIPPVEALDGSVHSSRIRGLIAEHGNVAEAAALLGRPYQLWGEVQRGAGRGHDLGYPTANLAVEDSRLVPAHGIYACWAWLGPDGAEGRPAAVSIGVRPTFDNGPRSVEAYLLDYEGDLYGQRLGLSFLQRLRPEQRFPNVEALIAQMAADVAATREITGSPRDDTGMESWEPGAGAWLPPTIAQRPTHNPQTPAWEELRHTADWAIRVHGGTLRQLFARAAQAMYTLQDADPTQPIALARALSVDAADASELIVAWLNRLLLEQELHDEMYTRFEIDDLSDTGLRGVAYGYRGSPSHTAVKAVTFWNLDVTEADSGWTARITFDV